jgi:hypothetical protein
MYDCEICIQTERDAFRRNRERGEEYRTAKDPFTQLVPLAKAQVRFVQAKMEFEQIQLRSGDCFDGPLDMAEIGRMLQTSYWVIFRDGARFLVNSAEGSDRWYFKRMHG